MLIVEAVGTLEQILKPRPFLEAFPREWGVRDLYSTGRIGAIPQLTFTSQELTLL